MFSHERKVVFSFYAQCDVDDILQYTVTAWGDAQMIAYKETLNNGLNLLRQLPTLGKQFAVSNNELMRIFPVGEHNIIYSYNDLSIHIMRVVHKHMSLERLALN